VYRIACESLRNAFRHALATRIEVQIRYDQRQFWIQILDNGKGIDPAVLTAGRSGHYGLPGIRERAELAGGKLSVRSRLRAGTEIQLTIPAAIAYIKSPTSRRWA
jgi:signal transduction histidine kinase